MPRASLAHATATLAAQDPVLAALVERHGPPRLPSRSRGAQRFEVLASAIVYQQLAGRAASAIYGRFVASLGGAVTPEAILSWSPEAARACGLSGAKTAALWDLAEKVSAGEVSLERIGRLSDDDVVAHLVQVRGIGRWTAEMFLLGHLGRLDVWPVGDYGVRAGYAAGWGLAEIPAPNALAEMGERYRPYRSVVAWYCWRVVDTR